MERISRVLDDCSSCESVLGIHFCEEKSAQRRKSRPTKHHLIKCIHFDILYEFLRV